MCSRLVRAVFLIVSLLSLAATFTAAARQAGAAGTSEQTDLRTWSDRGGEHHTAAALLSVKVTLEKEDGTTVTVPWESLSDADREYVIQQIAKNNAASAPLPERGLADESKHHRFLQQGGRNIVDIGQSGGKKSAAVPPAQEVVVTGVGTDSETAMQNAFSQAMEQSVGLLVDAETVVKNDRLIRDEILTYSRGYVEKYEVVSRWQDGGLHHTKIRAVVARDKLVEKLTRNQDRHTGGAWGNHVSPDCIRRQERGPGC